MLLLTPNAPPKLCRTCVVGASSRLQIQGREKDPTAFLFIAIIITTATRPLWPLVHKRLTTWIPSNRLRSFLFYSIMFNNNFFRAILLVITSLALTTASSNSTGDSIRREMNSTPSRTETPTWSLIPSLCNRS